jgi:hypothetical protein
MRSVASIVAPNPDAGRRVEVEQHPIRAVEPVDARVPGVTLDAAGVDHPQKRQLVVDERRMDRARATRLPVVTTSGARAIHRGMATGASFWKKCLPCQPSG